MGWTIAERKTPMILMKFTKLASHIILLFSFTFFPCLFQIPKQHKQQLLWIQSCRNHIQDCGTGVCHRFSCLPAARGKSSQLLETQPWLCLDFQLTAFSMAFLFEVPFLNCCQPGPHHGQLYGIPAVHAAVPVCSSSSHAHVLNGHCLLRHCGTPWAWEGKEEFSSG